MRKITKILAAVLSCAMIGGTLAACGGGTGASDSSSAGQPSQSTPAAKYYTVTFDADGGKLTGGTSVQVEQGKSVTLPSAEKEGYTLTGWFDGDTLAGEAGASYTPTANVTLKARWEADSAAYAAINKGRAVEYGKLIEELYWNSDTKLSKLTPDGGTPYCWPYTEQLSMVNAILLTMDETDEDPARFLKTTSKN